MLKRKRVETQNYFVKFFRLKALTIRMIIVNENVAKKTFGRDKPAFPLKRTSYYQRIVALALKVIT